MKFLKLSSYVIASILFLSACGQASTSEQDNTPVKEGQSGKTETESKTSTKEKKDENEVESGPLTIIGQWTKDDDGAKVTLKKISKVDRTIEMEPMKLTLNEVKVLERVGGSQEGNTIQITYTAENTSDKEVVFHPIKTLTTNTKHQINALSEDMSGSSDFGEFYGEVVKDGIVIVPYPEEDVTNLKSLKLITGDVWNNDLPEKYFEAVTEEIIFE